MVDGVTCDDEASVANKTKPDKQGLGVAVFERLTGTPQKAANNIAFARRIAIHLTGIMVSPVEVKGQPIPAIPMLTHAAWNLLDSARFVSAPANCD